MDESLQSLHNTLSNVTDFCYNITIINDKVTELNESFLIEISSVDADVIIIENNFTVVTILDDDCKYNVASNYFRKYKLLHLCRNTKHRVILNINFALIDCFRSHQFICH